MKRCPDVLWLPKNQMNGYISIGSTKKVSSKEAKKADVLTVVK